MKTIKDLSLQSKRVLVRVDYNVPFRTDGRIADTTRIDVSLPTIRHIIAEGGTPVLLTHRGRPKGEYHRELQLHEVRRYLAEILDKEVVYVERLDFEVMQEAITNAATYHQVVLLENVRFFTGELSNDDELAKQFADLADIYVNEAFSVSHREHASVVGIPSHMPVTACGLYFESEVQSLSEVLHRKAHPMTLVLGGVKVDTKLGALQKLLLPSDNYIIGGGLANTFLYAQGYEVGLSLAEHEKRSDIQHMMLEMEFDHDELYLPHDVVVADDPNNLSFADMELEAVTPDMYILDIGSETADRYAEILRESKTIIWNGPMGKYELEPYRAGTKKVAEAIAANTSAMRVIGGGDTIDALRYLNMPWDLFDHVSTAGGALLDFMEHESLPGIEALQ